jgi:hypothetical protein
MPRLSPDQFVSSGFSAWLSPFPSVAIFRWRRHRLCNQPAIERPINALDGVLGAAARRSPDSPCSRAGHVLGGYAAQLARRRLVRLRPHTSSLE